ncbi:MAG: SDR family NAD(P)-dependent oxidoreductase [Acidimicrobiales bacterium]
MEDAFGHPQSVVVLGGSSEIARAITKRLCAARTRTVVLAGRNAALLSDAADEARAYGATKVEHVLFDAEEPHRAGATVREAFEKVDDPVDLVIIAVGQLGTQSGGEDSDAVAQLITVNFTWPSAALAEARRLLIAQGFGRILVISSFAAVRSRGGAYLYSGAKAGLDRVCVGLAQSLEGTGVKLQILRPGVVRTKMSRGLREPPFTTGTNDVAEIVMRALGTDDVVIWSPPILRYVAVLISHLPTALWRRIGARDE